MFQKLKLQFVSITGVVVLGLVRWESEEESDMMPVFTSLPICEYAMT